MKIEKKYIRVSEVDILFKTQSFGWDEDNFKNLWVDVDKFCKALNDRYEFLKKRKEKEQLREIQGEKNEIS